MNICWDSIKAFIHSTRCFNDHCLNTSTRPSLRCISVMKISKRLWECRRTSGRNCRHGRKRTSGGSTGCFKIFVVRSVQCFLIFTGLNSRDLIATFYRHSWKIDPVPANFIIGYSNLHDFWYAITFSVALSRSRWYQKIILEAFKVDKSFFVPRSIIDSWPKLSMSLCVHIYSLRVKVILIISLLSLGTNKKYLIVTLIQLKFTFHESNCMNDKFFLFFIVKI